MLWVSILLRRFKCFEFQFYLDGSNALSFNSTLTAQMTSISPYLTVQMLWLPILLGQVKSCEFEFECACAFASAVALRLALVPSQLRLSCNSFPTSTDCEVITKEKKRKKRMDEPFATCYACGINPLLLATPAGSCRPPSLRRWSVCMIVWLPKSMLD